MSTLTQNTETGFYKISFQIYRGFNLLCLVSSLCNTKESVVNRSIVLSTPSQLTEFTIDNHVLLRFYILVILSNSNDAWAKRYKCNAIIHKSISHEP